MLTKDIEKKAFVEKIMLKLSEKKIKNAEKSDEKDYTVE
jgi:hypothetical protein